MSSGVPFDSHERWRYDEWSRGAKSTEGAREVLRLVLAHVYEQANQRVPADQIDYVLLEVRELLELIDAAFGHELA